jgi:hypothetical protein
MARIVTQHSRGRSAATVLRTFKERENYTLDPHIRSGSEGIAALPVREQKKSGAEISAPDD